MTLRYDRRYLPVGLEAAKKEKRREEKRRGNGRFSTKFI